MTSSVCDIEKLTELFRFAENANDQLDDETDDALPANNVKCKAPQKGNNKVNPYAKLEPPERRVVLDPDQDDDLYFEDAGKSEQQKDWKRTPKWDISYRQSVTPSDMFLGMSLKTPSTSSCENMVVDIQLPGENRQNLDLKIEKEKLTLISPKYYLDLKLPHPVDPKRGNAQFDKDQEKLVITLIMDRELDLVNF